MTLGELQELFGPMVSLYGHYILDERGATAIEYALVAGLISIAAVIAMTVLGQNLNEFFFSDVSQTLQDAAGS